MRKIIDPKIRQLIENGIILNERSMFVIVGDRGRDQVIHLDSLYTNYTLYILICLDCDNSCPL